MPNLELLRSELVRVTDWIKFADQKSAFLSAYYTVVAGFAVTQRTSVAAQLLQQPASHQYLAFILIIGAMLLFIGGVYFLLSSVFPRLKNKWTDRSFFYFGNIAKMKYADFAKDIESLSDDDVRHQMIEQIHTNSVIASTKMRYVQKSAACLTGLVFVLVILWWVTF